MLKIQKLHDKRTGNLHTHTHAHTLLWCLNWFICSKKLLIAEQYIYIYKTLTVHLHRLNTSECADFFKSGLKHQPYKETSVSVIVIQMYCLFNRVAVSLETLRVPPTKQDYNHLSDTLVIYIYIYKNNKLTWFETPPSPCFFLFFSLSD